MKTTDEYESQRTPCPSQKPVMRNTRSTTTIRAAPDGFVPALDPVFGRRHWQVNWVPYTPPNCPDTPGNTRWAIVKGCGHMETPVYFSFNPSLRCSLISSERVVSFFMFFHVKSPGWMHLAKEHLEWCWCWYLLNWCCLNLWPALLSGSRVDLKFILGARCWSVGGATKTSSRAWRSGDALN